jgi:hypothetical protein
VTPVNYVDVVASAKKTNLTQEIGRKKTVGKIACVKKSQPKICQKNHPFFQAGQNCSFPANSSDSGWREVPVESAVMMVFSYLNSNNLRTETGPATQDNPVIFPQKSQPLYVRGQSIIPPVNKW